jgi:hypothetical protein
LANTLAHWRSRRVDFNRENANDATLLGRLPATPGNKRFGRIDAMAHNLNEVRTEHQKLLSEFSGAAALAR